MKLKSSKFGEFSFPTDYDVIKSVVLNKTDLAEGNNKFYNIEAHMSKDGKKYRLYSCYGRVGTPGVKEERIPGQSKEALLEAFEDLFSEKTSNKKGYKEVKVATTKTGSDQGNKLILSDDIKKDNLTHAKANTNISAPVASLVTRLYNEAGQACSSQLNTGQLNATAENPLGTLTLTQINDGRSILQDIQKLLKKDKSLIDSAEPELVRLSNQFYTTIPQVIPLRPKKAKLTDSEFGKNMEVYLRNIALNNTTKLDEKEDLLDLLIDVKGMISGFATTDIAKKYAEIGCKFNILDQSTQEFQSIKDYVISTRSSHHHWGIKVERIWKIAIGKQLVDNLPVMQRIGNIKPLFHGSRPANILGICRKGLIQRPPGVYITGSMFGASGLYFADQSSKSEQYAIARFGGGAGNGSTYFMFVADVALGKVKKYQTSQPWLDQPPAGYDSVQGEKGSSLLHNEFIIYNAKQHILQYLIEFSQI